MPKIRPAVPTDLRAVVALGVEALERDPEPDLRIDRESITGMVRECISGPSHFCWVCEDDDGQVVGVVSAMVEDMALYERKQATVWQFYCKAPGWGVKLIREFLRWVKPRRIVKRVVFQLERDADPRIAVMLKRMGLKSAGEVFAGAPSEFLGSSENRIRHET